ncbi:MAG: hypothetical protein ACYTE3_15135 [Planctomycetota bacterium]|jgi:hypothetical protein
MSIKIIPAMLACIVLGFVLGIIPFVNEHLHWNLYIFIPVSGLIFGAGLGCVCFWICFGLNQRIRILSTAILAISAAVGYVAVDYGIYRSTYVTIQDVEGMPDGQYKVSELVSFREVMRFALGSSSISAIGGDEFEMGPAATTISYVVDLIGALAGSAGILFACSRRYPYCEKCSRFKTRQKKYQIAFQFDEKVADQVSSTIRDLAGRSDYEGIISYFEKLSESFPGTKGNIRIHIDHRHCLVCREGTVLGRAYQRVRRGWKEVDGLRFAVVSEPGVDVTLLEPAAQVSI